MSIIALFEKVKKLNLNNYYNTNNIIFAKDHVFIFLLYNIIN